MSNQRERELSTPDGVLFGGRRPKPLPEPSSDHRFRHADIMPGDQTQTLLEFSSVPCFVYRYRGTYAAVTEYIHRRSWMWPHQETKQFIRRCHPMHTLPRHIHSFTACSSPFLGSAIHLTELGAWSKQYLLGRTQHETCAPPALHWMRKSVIIRRRPCMT